MDPDEEKPKPTDLVENSPIIRSIGVEKIYDTGEVRVHALRGLDLEISRGEMVAVMGPSGCGKTTLLNCLSGIDEIDDGKILIEDKDISKMSDRERTEYRAKKMGFIFQSYNLLPVLSALENVQLPLLVSGVNVKASKEKAMNALEVVGLKDWAKHKPSELSGGQQQRVAIARSLVNDPVIVWADEPTGNLDKENTVQIMKLLSTLNKEKNQTYVVVTHDPLVSGMADRIVRMENGRIVE
ncbi:MAG: ABC transporter ATP-binding protein [Methanomassiliicoccales archaeon]|nr:ABC transporter ATP-binding protein [Methanomassiliicoccales archaeon]NYT16003.1 ABC transporter ATP-binding protein [Methanomassiliicoccales archaeon]